MSESVAVERTALAVAIVTIMGLLMVLTSGPTMVG